jgi:hypothetical protein
MFEHKLTPEEISRAVRKIRQRYDEYVFKFFKSRTLKFAFEDRYRQMLRQGADISTFLMAEISAIEELLEREEQRVVSGERAAEAKESFSAKVDKVLEEQRRLIRKYPDVEFHRDAGEEPRRLLGALGDLEQQHWDSLMRLLRETAYSRSSLVSSNLENRLRYLAVLDADRVSSGLSRYLYHLNRFPRDYQAIDREAKEYILESAFFLHELNDLLLRVSSNYPQLGEKQRERLGEIQSYVWGMIQDFRLKDFKPRK